MASVQKILYEDKELFQESPLPEIQKATFTNYNEIKNVVNFNADELNSRPSAVQDSDNTFDVDTGVADAYVLTLDPPITAYKKGQLFSFEAVNANATTTPTIDVNGQGAQTIINRDGTALSPGDIPTNSNSIIQYDGTNFQLLTTLAGGGGAAWIPDLTTGTGAAVQNTATSDTTAQTSTNTFDGLKWTIDVTGRVSTGEVTFLNFFKTDTGTTNVFKVDIEGKVTVASSTSGDAGYFFAAGSGLFERSAGDVRLNIGSSATAIAFGSTSVRFGADTFSAQILMNDSITVPSYRWDSDDDTGLGRTGVNALALYSAGIRALEIDSSQITTTKSQLKTTASTTLAAINIGSFAGDPSALVDNDLWGNSSTNKIRARENGVSVDVITSASLSILNTITLTLSSAQILAINTTPIELVPAQGTNTLIIIDSYSYDYTFVTAAYTGDTTLRAEYGTTNNIAYGTPNFSFAAATDRQNAGSNTGSQDNVSNGNINQAVNLTTVTSDPLSGGGNIKVTVVFHVMNLA